jgi:acyl carrier protein
MVAQRVVHDPDPRKSEVHMNEIKDKIRAFILSECLPGESSSNLTDETPLRTSGVVDSIATLSLVTFLENTFDIVVDAHETGIDNFDRIQDIAQLVQRKLIAKT